MLLENAGALLSGVMSGGITGLLGIGIQQWGEASKRAHDLLMTKEQNQLTLQLAAAESAARLQLATVNAASAERLAELEALSRADATASADYATSMANDKATYLTPGAAEKSRLVRWMLGFVDFIRGMIRPTITMYSMVLQTFLLWWVHNLFMQSSSVFTDDLKTKLMIEVIGTTSYIVTTTTVWWFGARPAQRK